MLRSARSPLRVSEHSGVFRVPVEWLAGVFCNPIYGSGCTLPLWVILSGAQMRMLTLLLNFPRRAEQVW
jgi:hypothetical protein